MMNTFTEFKQPRPIKKRDQNFKTVIGTLAQMKLNPLAGKAFAKAMEGVLGMCVIYFYSIC